MYIIYCESVSFEEVISSYQNKKKIYYTLKYNKGNYQWVQNKKPTEVYSMISSMLDSKETAFKKNAQSIYNKYPNLYQAILNEILPYLSKRAKLDYVNYLISLTIHEDSVIKVDNFKYNLINTDRIIVCDNENRYNWGDLYYKTNQYNMEQNKPISLYPLILKQYRIIDHGIYYLINMHDIVDYNNNYTIGENLYIKNEDDGYTKISEDGKIYVYEQDYQPDQLPINIDIILVAQYIIYSITCVIIYMILVKLLKQI